MYERGTSTTIRRTRKKQPKEKKKRYELINVQPFLFFGSPAWVNITHKDLEGKK